MKETSIALLCWDCARQLTELLERSQFEEIPCEFCGSVTKSHREIYQAISPTQQRTYERFVAEYEMIRTAEGRGSLEPAYYQALPYEDLSGKLSGQWKIRARTFDYLRAHILPKRPARILDLGAGNGWLSNRLALGDHHPVAVDLLINATDGLGAATHFATRFPRVQAELDHLPFASGTFDLALFNASFHYSVDYRRTLSEALRCTRKGGLVVIADSPWYADERMGLRMVAEKRDHFYSTYGFASNSVPSMEFLTPASLQNLGKALNLRWQRFRPFYGLSWSLRPMKARMLKRRTPSRFNIFVAEVPA